MVGTYAGVGSAGFSGDGGDATSAKLDTPFESSVWVETTKMMFITDHDNNRIRKVDPDSKIFTTVAGIFYSLCFLVLKLFVIVFFPSLGSSLSTFSGDGGKATSAGVPQPGLVCSDTTGILYLGCGSARICKVDSSGIFSTFAGRGTVSAPPSNISDIK